jgi:tubulin beta
VLKQTTPKYSDLNWVISLVMAGVTASLRFPGKLNGDLRKLGVNLVPFPRLHFFLIAHSPLLSPNESGHVKLTIQEVTSQMWSSRNFLANVKAEDGKYLSASLGYRGAQLSSQEIDDQVQQVQQKLEEDFVKWIPNNIKSSIINVPPNESVISGTFVANTTSMKSVFQRIATQFAKMYKRKAFLHWYKGEGMDEMEFQEADKNLRDLVTEYQDKQDAVVDVQGGGQEEEHHDDEEQHNEEQNDNNEEQQQDEEQPQEQEEF